MSGECNYCGGDHAEDSCDADRETVFRNGYASGEADAYNQRWVFPPDSLMFAPEGWTAEQQRRFSREYARGYRTSLGDFATEARAPEARRHSCDCGDADCTHCGQYPRGPVA